MIKISFSIPFFSNNGEEIHIIGSIPELQGTSPQHSKAMRYEDGEWKLTISVKNESRFSYSYLLKRGETFYPESGPAREYQVKSKENHHIIDYWREWSSNTPFYSTPFTKILNQRALNTLQNIDNSVSFKLFGSSIPQNSQLYFVGGSKSTGNWNPESALEMFYIGKGEWQLSLPLESLPSNLEYKYLVKESVGESVQIHWEGGENRLFKKEGEIFNRSITVNDFPLRLSPYKIRIAGSAIPLFSLKSKESCGVGDFGDLKLMVDFLSESGMNLLQLLPINDTTRCYNDNDSYPYSAISGYAIHPIYMNLKWLGKIKEREFRERHNKKQERLNKQESVDWEGVIRAKWLYIREIFKQEWDKTSKTKEYKNFYKENEHWLLPYATFSHLRDRYKSAQFTNWPRYNTYNKEEALEMLTPESKCQKEIQFYLFMQFHLYKQLNIVHSYASSKRVVLKGDIPIGIDRFSAENWSEPHLFDATSKMGAPPDYFSQMGQIWGFPLYNWQAMELEGFEWWKRRIKKMSELYDAFRIDHILGFFRIWQVDESSTDGRLGHFVPSLPFSINQLDNYGYKGSFSQELFIKDRDNINLYHPAISAKSTESYNSLNKQDKRAYERLYSDYYYGRNDSLWEKNGIKHLAPLLTASGMLACGEDLGMIPPPVPKVMNHYKILSLELERMPKIYGASWHPSQFPYLSVSTTSTHDTETLREWWVFSKKEELNAPKDCPATKASEIIEAHLKAPSMISVIPLQDLLSLSDKLRAKDFKRERINDPSNSNHIWNYRLHLTLEQLLEEREFIEKIRGLIIDSGRVIN